MHRDTRLIHAEAAAGGADSAIAPPISLSSTYRSRDREAFALGATEARNAQFYARHGGPTHGHAVRLIAELEGAETALLFSSGMAAMSGTVLALLRAGDHVVCQRSHYGGTSHLAADVLPAFGIESSVVDQTDTGAFAAAMRLSTRLVIAESPSNPVLAVTDIPVVADIAHSHSALLLVDNTLATPISQRPLQMGADIVMHSATKYLGGHSDLLAGAIAGTHDLIERVWRMSLSLGANLGAFDAWLLARGMRTLGLRVERQNQSALAVARFLHRHERVAEVHYPGLDTHPQHELASRQMEGFGGVLSIRVRGGLEAAESMLDRLRLFSRAPSLGGVESLAVRPSAMLASVLSEEEFARRGVPADLVRLSVGIENIDDLILDIDQALTEGA